MLHAACCKMQLQNAAIFTQVISQAIITSKSIARGESHQRIRISKNYQDFPTILRKSDKFLEGVKLEGESLMVQLSKLCGIISNFF